MPKKTIKFDELLQKKFTAEEVQEIELRAQRAAKAEYALKGTVQRCLSRYLEKHKVSRYQVARDLHMSYTNLSKILNAETVPSGSTIAKLFALMGDEMPFMQELVDASDQPHSQV